MEFLHGDAARGQHAHFMLKEIYEQLQPVLNELRGCMDFDAASAIAVRQVRLATSGSMAVSYVRAICRLSTGWRWASFLEWRIASASASSLVRKLCRLPVVVSSE